MRQIRGKMQEIDFQLTGERYRLLENQIILHPDEDFCTYVGESEYNLSEFSDILSFFKRNGFLELSFKDSYIFDCLEKFKAPVSQGSETLFSSYIKTRLSVIDIKHYNDNILQNQYARTFALMAIPKEIIGKELKINITTELTEEHMARLFYQFDRMRKKDAEHDLRLIHFARRYIK